MKWIVTILFLSLTLGATAQKKGARDAGKTPPPVDVRGEIRVLAESCGDSIVLRWGPTNSETWSSLNKSGYLVERIDLTEVKHPVRTVLTPQPLKPLTLDQFKARFGPNNKYAAIAAQSFYGKNFNTNLRSGQAGIKDQADVWKNRYAFAMEVADFDGEVAKAEGLRFTDTRVQH